MDFEKNYNDNEKLKADIAALNDDLYEMFRRLNQMSTDYSHHSGNLADRLAGMILLDAKNDIAKVSEKVNQLAFQFTQ
jgi:hypothetical protein